MLHCPFITGDFAAVAMPAPVLNSPEFEKIFGGNDGQSLPLDEQGLLRPIEIILLPSAKVKITGRCGRQICKITTADYVGENLFIDARFLNRAEDTTPERLVKVPKMQALIDRLKRLTGVSYVWGGNWSLGIPEMLEFYPPQKQISSELQTIWSLQGVDCTGLLYETTDGATPRNSSQLLNYGLKVPIYEMNAEQIHQILKPLDLIVWAGHIVIVLDRDIAIESKKGRGVIVSDLFAHLKELMEEKIPVNDWNTTAELGSRFVVRRWHPETRFL